MAFLSGQKSRVIAGDFHFSPVTAQWSHESPVDTLDTSTIVDTAKQFIVGQNMSTFTMSGWLDVDATADAHFDQMNDWKSATAAEALSIAPNGFALSSEVVLIGALESKFTVGSQVADKATFSLDAQTDGQTDFGVSLKDLAAVTGNTNGSSNDNAASSAGGGVGHLHVTAFTGFTNIVVKVQHSTDNFSGSVVDLVTFTTVTGLTQQRSAVTGTVNRYLRYVVTVTGSGSATFQVSFARR
jgi:hypothetical protein